MTISLIDSYIFRNSYGTKEMREVFNDRARIQAWLDVEASLARAQAKLNIIPKDAAKEINTKAKAENIEIEKMKTIYEKTGHPIVPLVNLLKEACIKNYGEYVHWGATTQDIMDTGNILQVKKAIKVMKKQLEELKGICLNLSQIHKNTLQAGRTHGQQAVPITFGYKVAVWVEEIKRHLVRIKQCQPRLLVLEFSGAAGTLATIDVDKGFKLQEILSKELGLNIPPVPWHSSRDNLAEILSILAMIAATMAKIANEVIVLQSTEIAEVEQGQEGRIGSSTMPHKRNPMQFEHVVVLSKFVRANANIMIEAMIGEHERDWSSWGAEMKIVEESFILTGALLQILNSELSKIKINKEKMKSNLALLKGLIMSERVMMQLAKSVGRQTAHTIIHDDAMEAFELKKEFGEILKTDSRIKDFLSEEEIDSLMDPATYIGLAPRYVDRVCGNIKKEEKDKGNL